jgi:hypothetical protein
MTQDDGDNTVTGCTPVFVPPPPSPTSRAELLADVNREFFMDEDAEDPQHFYTWLNYSTSTPPLGSASTPYSPTGSQSSSSRQLVLPPTSASSSTLSLLVPTPRSRRWLTWSTPYAPRPPPTRLLSLASHMTPRLLPDQCRGLPMLFPTPQASAGLVDTPTSGLSTFARGSDPFPPIPIPTLPRSPPQPLAYPSPLWLRKRGAALPFRRALSKWPKPSLTLPPKLSSAPSMWCLVLLPLSLLGPSALGPASGNPRFMAPPAKRWL